MVMYEEEKNKKKREKTPPLILYILVAHSVILFLFGGGGGDRGKNRHRSIYYSREAEKKKIGIRIICAYVYCKHMKNYTHVVR